MATVSGPLTLPLIGEDVGEVDGEGFGVDGGDHLFAGDDFDELRAGLANLVVEGVAVRLLDDDFVAGEGARVGDGDEAIFEVFGHHGGVADDHGGGGTAGDEAGVAGGGLAELRDELSGGDFELVDEDEVLVAAADELHDLGLHDGAADDGYGADDVDEGAYAEFGIDVPGVA